jgi:hypothetical protein
MIKVFENFLNEEYANEIYDLHTDLEFPWFHSPHTDKKSALDKIQSNELKSKVVGNYQFQHIYYEEQINSDFFSNILPMVENKDFLKIDKLTRIKANFNTIISNYSKDNIQIPHTDLNKRYESVSNLIYSLLYYVNDSDGDTVFYDEKENEIFRSTPKKGKAVLFNSTILHCACNPIKTNKRIVINFVYKAKEII